MTDSDQATTAPRFHKIFPLRAHEEVMGQILFAIRAGILAVGDRLPTIDEMAQSTGVSKPVIGEAVRVLRERGVVESKRGVQGGVTVIDDDLPIDLFRLYGWPDAGLTDLVEARKPIETELALLASERATDEDLAAMRASVDRLEVAAEKADGSFIRFDHLFHYQIGQAARSELLARFQHRILVATAVALHDYDLYHENRDLVIKTHREMLRAIEQGDPDAIREACQHHWATSGGAFASIDDLTQTHPAPSTDGHRRRSGR